MAKEKTKKLTKYPKQYQFSIGIVIIGFIFIYMIYHLFTYITAENTTIYEVSQGSISSNLEYNALAIRDETIVNAESSGTIIYLAENFGKVSVRSNVYALDESGQILSSVSDTTFDETTLNSKDIKALHQQISNFAIDYNNDSFNKVYSFKTDLESQINQLYNLAAMDSLSAQVQDAVSAGSFHIYKAPSPGVIVYSIDGMEDISLDNYTPESFDKNNLSYVNLKANNKVEAGQPIYKLVNSDYWQLVCEVDAAVYNSLCEKKYIEIEFLEDQTKTWTSCTFNENYGKYYIILHLDDSMPKFADNRYVHIKILNNDIKGLKIPISSIVYKDFFKIPKSYFFEGGNNTSNAGLMIEGENGTTNFVIPTIYNEDDDNYYVDDEKIKSGDILIKADSGERYLVGTDIEALKGVYNVNKGYAVFKLIDVKYDNEDYAIISTNTKYGISMYDHIVLQGDAVEENKIINK